MIDRLSRTGSKMQIVIHSSTNVVYWSIPDHHCEAKLPQLNSLSTYLWHEDIRQLEAFEIWIWRRMMKVPWTEHKTNEEILKMVETERKLMDIPLEVERRDG